MPKGLFYSDWQDLHLGYPVLWQYFGNFPAIRSMKKAEGTGKESIPMRIGRRYATDVMDIDTLPTITCYTGKVLILHGDKDTLVDISGSQKGREAYEAAGADVHFQIIPGGGHIFLNPKHIKTATNAITEFAVQINGKE